MLDQKLLQDKKDFLAEILKHEKSKFDDNLIENKLEPPKELVQYLKGAGLRGKRWFREIKESKFQYLILKNNYNSEAREEFFKLKRNEAALWEDYVTFWDNSSDFEEVAYISRFSQHGYDRNLVYDNWYNNLKTFRNWASLCEKKLEDCEKSFKSKEFNAAFKELHNKIATGKSNIYDQTLHSLVEQAITNGVSFKAELIYQYLAGNVSVFKELSNRYQVNENEVLSWLSELFNLATDKKLPAHTCHDSGCFINATAMKLFWDLANIVSERQLGREESIRTFLKIIKDSSDFKCDVSDFMQVITTKAGSQLSLLTSTVKGPTAADREAMKRLKENQSYQEKVGITGSVFVSPRDKAFFHVGSNCLKKDFRQSEEQKSFYEEEYYKGHLKAGKGKIGNFCEFPIYDDKNELQYAVRVVNRADPTNQDSLHNMAWDIPTKLRLYFLIRQFSDVLKYVSIGLPEIVRKSLTLDWIEEGKLRTLLDHLQRVASRRVETRDLGCTIMVVGKDNESEVNQLSEPEVHLEIPRYVELENMFDYYDALGPDKCCLIFDENLKIFSAKIFEDNMNMLAALNRFTRRNKDSIVFHIDEGHRVIQIYQEGKPSGEVYFSEAMGQWAFRNYDEILGDISPNVQQIPRSLLKKALDLSYLLSASGLGALLIIGNNLEQKIKCKTPIALTERRTLEDINTDMKSLLNLAKLDGAMLIEVTGDDNGMIQKVHAKIETDEEMVKTMDEENGKESELKRLYDTVGSRHKTGILTSMKCPNALVLIVSQNRIITALSGTRTVGGEPYYLRRF